MLITAVGYNGNDLRLGNKMIMPSFIGVGENDSFCIDNIIVDPSTYPAYDPEEEEGGTGNQVTIKILNAQGGVDTDDNGKLMTYGFYDNGKTQKLGKGWYQGGTVSADNKVNALPIKAGQGLWVYSTKNTLKLKFIAPASVKGLAE